MCTFCTPQAQWDGNRDYVVLKFEFPTWVGSLETSGGKHLREIGHPYSIGMLGEGHGKAPSTRVSLLKHLESVNGLWDKEVRTTLIEVPLVVAMLLARAANCGEPRRARPSELLQSESAALRGQAEFLVEVDPSCTSESRGVLR